MQILNNPLQVGAACADSSWITPSFPYKHITEVYIAIFVMAFSNVLTPFSSDVHCHE